MKPNIGPHKFDCKKLSKSGENETKTEDYLTLPLSDDTIIIELLTLKMRTRHRVTKFK